MRGPGRECDGSGRCDPSRGSWESFCAAFHPRETGFLVLIVILVILVTTRGRWRWWPWASRPAVVEVIVS